MTQPLKVNVLIGLHGSGKSTWLKNNHQPATYFDDINITTEGLSDDDVDRLRDLMHDSSLKEISISDPNFADVKQMFQALDYLHTLIESSGREETYQFILFPQSEAHCIRNVKERNDGRNVLPEIQKYSPIIKQSFLFIKNRFPRFVEEVTFSPLMDTNKSVPQEPTFGTIGLTRAASVENFEHSTDEHIVADEAPIAPPSKRGFLGLLRGKK